MKRSRKFDGGGTVSSSPQSAFNQSSSAYPSAGGGLGNYAPLVQIGNEGVSANPSAPSGSTGPLNFSPAVTQPAQSTPAMKKGGAVKSGVKGWGKARGARAAKIV